MAKATSTQIPIKYGSGRPSDVQRTVAELLKAIAIEAQSWILENDRIASGQTISGFAIRVERKSNGSTRYVLSGAKQTPFALQGRDAGKPPPFEAIRQWVDEKDLKSKDGRPAPKTEKEKDSFAWAVRRKIANDGTEQPRLTDNEIDQFFFDSWERYGGTLADEAALEVADISTELFKKSGYKVIKVKTKQ